MWIVLWRINWCEQQKKSYLPFAAVASSFNFSISNYRLRFDIHIDNVQWKYSVHRSSLFFFLLVIKLEIVSVKWSLINDNVSKCLTITKKKRMILVAVTVNKNGRLEPNNWELRKIFRLIIIDCKAYNYYLA